MAGNINTITNNLKPTTEHLKSITQKLDEIDYVNTVNSINHTLAGLQDFTDKLNSSVTPALNSLKNPNSTLGLLMNDRTLYDNLNNTASAADSLLNNLREHPKRYVHFSIFGKKEK